MYNQPLNNWNIRFWDKKLKTCFTNIEMENCKKPKKIFQDPNVHNKYNLSNYIYFKYQNEK